jgi:hypothetical protein
MFEAAWTELTTNFHLLSFAAGWAAGAAVQFVYREIRFLEDER